MSLLLGIDENRCEQISHMSGETPLLTYEEPFKSNVRGMNPSRYR